MKKIISTILTVVLSAALLLISACTSSSTVSGGTISYTVTVQSLGGVALSDVTVSAYKDGSESASLVTDSNGQVVFSLAADVYTLEVSNLPLGYIEPTTVYQTDTAGSDVTISLSSSIITGTEAPTNLIYEEGDIIYDFTYTNYYYDDDGNLVEEERKLSDSFADGKEMILLNFYYSSCSPCFTEFPLMNTAYLEYDNYVDVIAMCDSRGGGDSLTTAIEYRYWFKDSNGNTDPLEFYMSYDSGGSVVASHFDLVGYPTNVIIDRYGVICMIEAGGITDVNVFRNWFAKYTAEDYVTDIGNEYELEIPDIDNPDVEDIATALNDSSIDGKITYYWEEDDEYTWPWILSDNGGIETPIASKAGAYAIIYADITLAEDEVLAFDYKTSTESGSDIFYVFIDGEIIYEYSGSEEEDFLTCYAYVGNGETHQLALAYVKDTGNDVGDDTVYIKNMRVTNEAELVSEGVTLDVLRQAATGYNADSNTYTEYVDVYYNSDDGYYHVGSENGPYLLVNLSDDTQFSSSIYSWAIETLTLYNYGLYDENDPEFILIGENLGTSSDPYYEYYELIEKYAWYGTYSTYTETLTPVTQELKEYLVKLVAALGNDDATDNETEWLEMCRYYEQYGVPVDNSEDPLLGLSIETAIVANMGDNSNVYMEPKSPRGAVFSFVPAVSGAYEISTSDIVVTSGSDCETYLWLYDAESYGTDILNPGSPITETEGGSIVWELEAGVTYYIACALADPNYVGTCTLSINYYSEDYIIRNVASDAYTFDTTTGEISLPQYIDVQLMSGTYYAVDDYGEVMSPIYIDFVNSTSFSDSSLYAWIESGMFDFSENGYYATDEDEYELWVEYVPEEYRVDWTDLMREYYESRNNYGYVVADEQLVEILQILMDLEDRFTDNAWLQLCFYIQDLTVIEG